jgi:hypothetical protein
MKDPYFRPWFSSLKDPGSLPLKERWRNALRDPGYLVFLGIIVLVVLLLAFGPGHP